MQVPSFERSLLHPRYWLTLLWSWHPLLIGVAPLPGYLCHGHQPWPLFYAFSQAA